MKTTRRIWLIGCLALSTSTAALSIPSNAFADELGPDEIVRRADEVRNPSESYFLKLTVTSADRPNEPSEFDVFITGNSKAVVRTVRPVRDRGRNLLMLDENMWVYVPNLKRAVRVSLNQRLVGQAANGDISRMRWAGDYSAILESETASQWQLLLTASKRGLTYEKVRVFIEKGSFHPLRAEYLTSGLRPLKTATFRAYKDLCGKVRPSEILIQDAVRPDDQSVLQVQQMELRSFPSSMYQPENLQ